MKCIQNLRDKCAIVGATLDEDSLRSGTIILDAPRGYVWGANGNPSISEMCANHGQTWFADAAHYIDTQMASFGLNKATEQTDLDRIRWDCDDDTWGASPDAPDHINWPS